MRKRFFRRIMPVLALALSAFGVIGVVNAPSASAYWPTGYVHTVGNTPTPGGSISCWQQVVNSTASILRCYKYNIAGTVVGTYEATLPTPFCNYTYWARTGSPNLQPILGVANGFMTDYPNYPNPNMNGGSPGCLQGQPQTGSQGWYKIWVHPNGVTEFVSDLSGGSWVNNMTAQRSRDCYPNDSGYQGYIYPYSPCIQTLILMG